MPFDLRNAEATLTHLSSVGWRCPTLAAVARAVRGTPLFRDVTEHLSVHAILFGLKRPLVCGFVLHLFFSSRSVAVCPRFPATVVRGWPFEYGLHRSNV